MFGTKILFAFIKKKVVQNLLKQLEIMYDERYDLYEKEAKIWLQVVIFIIIISLF